MRRPTHRGRCGDRIGRRHHASRRPTRRGHSCRRHTKGFRHRSTQWRQLARGGQRQGWQLQLDRGIALRRPDRCSAQAHRLKHQVAIKPCADGEGPGRLAVDRDQGNALACDRSVGFAFRGHHTDEAKARRQFGGECCGSGRRHRGGAQQARQIALRRGRADHRNRMRRGGRGAHEQSQTPEHDRCRHQGPDDESGESCQHGLIMIQAPHNFSVRAGKNPSSCCR